MEKNMDKQSAQEIISWLEEFLEKEGFSITWDIGDLNTAFVAEWGEGAQLERSQRKMAAQQRQIEERRRRAERFLKGASFSIGSPDQEKPSVAQTAFERKATCRICGTLTADWITYYGQSNECVCRECKDQIA